MCMKKVLVLGGTQFFGKKAVDRLLEKDYQVTIATRGNKPHPFGDRVEHIQLDARDGEHEGWQTVQSQNWDAVFHNVCYTKEDAELAIEKFKNVTEHLYYTSSLATYSGEKEGYREEDFDPLTYEIDPAKEVDYGEGKRQAEVVFFKEAPFHVTAFRFPIVLDEDDYTKRLHDYVEKGLKEETILFTNLDYKINFVKGSTAAESIIWAIENKKSGIYNVSSKDAITLKTLIQWIEEAVGKQVTVEETGESVSDSPFSIPYHWFLHSEKIEKEGFSLKLLENWLKPLIQTIAAEMEKNK